MGSILEMMTKREGGSVWKGEIPTAPQHNLASPSSAKPILTFSWLKESILFIAVSKAVTICRKLGSCSHRGLDSRSEEILTADLDMAVGNRSMQRKAERVMSRGLPGGTATRPLIARAGTCIGKGRPRAKIGDFSHRGGVQHNFPGRHALVVERKERKSHQFIHVNSQRTVFI